MGVIQTAATMAAPSADALQEPRQDHPPSTPPRQSALCSSIPPNSSLRAPFSHARFHVIPSPKSALPGLRPLLADQSRQIQVSPQPTMAVCRSTRRRKPKRSYQESCSDDQNFAPSPTLVGAKRQDGGLSTDHEKSGPPVRRAPKRKAAEQARSCYDDIPETIVEDSLAPIKPEERELWNHWVELESDPAFFTFILKELGVKDVKVMEVFSLDDEMLSIYPKPVYGLIFLYQYSDDDFGEDRPDCPEHVWFANQTVDNACATVAMLNIVMNVGVELGSQLEAFREATVELSSPLRGWTLSKNSFIRNIHNSFTTRNDYLNAELLHENNCEKANKPCKVPNRAKKPRASQKKTRKIDSENGFHFIAYVPIGKVVWELDGLQHKPQCMGEYDPDTADWISFARPTIEARMAEKSVNELSFNLLALCKARQDILRSELAASIKALDRLTQLDHPLVNSSPEEDCRIRPEPEALRCFELTPAAVDQVEIPKDVEGKINMFTSILASRGDDLGLETTNSIREFKDVLETEHRRLKKEFFDEVATMQEDEIRVSGRKKDYGPAIHLWVKKLAEKGILPEIVSDISASDT